MPTGSCWATGAPYKWRKAILWFVECGQERTVPRSRFSELAGKNRDFLKSRTWTGVRRHRHFRSSVTMRKIKSLQ